MEKLKLVYVCSLRNAAADMAGRMVEYKGGTRYMESPLEHLVKQLNKSELGDKYELQAVIFDDDLTHTLDREKLKGYGTSRIGCYGEWIYPQTLKVGNRDVDELLCCIPSSYRKLSRGSQAWREGKLNFEQRLEKKLDELGADVVLLDGLIVILDQLASEDSAYAKRIVNIHPGITREGSLYQRRGATATLDALYGAQGKQVTNWKTMDMIDTDVVDKTGASLHYIDQGIDSGPVIHDVLNTPITPTDTIFELRWNNFQQSLFPAMTQGLYELAQIDRFETEKM
ncbi:formyltransferase family protein [Pseudoalteromonas ostreae]|uniref:formyltransferase family protein n=1 Tax=Pseudoalteromonas ostreae TaxID=2774154 RepID=UPI001B3726DE|nr:formyltransferase family protein [Pseudoalteromonas ostreae]